MIMCEQNVNCRYDFTMFMNKNERMNEYRCIAKLTPQYADRCGYHASNKSFDIITL